MHRMFKRVPLPTPVRPAVAALLCFVGASGACAQSANPSEVIKGEPLSETWLNAGFYSYRLAPV